MSDYTPPTAQIRGDYIEAQADVPPSTGELEELGQEFDRWLAAHDAALTEKVLRAAAKDALTDYAEGRSRRRLWHIWLAKRALSTPPTTEDEGNN